MSEQISHPPLTILVLGGKGLLGQAIIKAIEPSQHIGIAISREQGDLADPNVLSSLLERFRPDRVVNAVGWTDVDGAEEAPEKAMHINRGVPAALNSVLKGTNIHLTHFSSDFVFNGRSEKPYTVEDTADPLSVYGKTKLAGEKAFSSLDPENVAIIRTAWLFGHGKKNFVKTILNKAEEESIVNVVHDQVGSPSFTKDVAEASLDIIEKPFSGLFHLVNSGIASWCELAAEAVRIAHVHCTVNAISNNDWPQKAKRPAYSVLDTSRYTELTGKTMRPWPKALQEYIFKEMAEKGQS